MACVALNRRKYLISIWAQYLGESPDISGFCDVIDNQSETTKWAGYEMSNRHFSFRCIKIQYFSESLASVEDTKKENE